MQNPMIQMLSNRKTNNPLQMMQEFSKFSNNMTPQRAQEIIQQKLASGEMTQKQFEDIKMQAQMFAQMFGIK